MNILSQIQSKETKLAIGLMSGTSADGIDTVIAEIKGFGKNLKIKQLAFNTYEFPSALRTRILEIAAGAQITPEEFCKLDISLGKIYAESCLRLCKDNGIFKNDIDFVGNHGQTIHHQPTSSNYYGFNVTGTLQIGDAAQINELMGCPVVSDFRSRDMAAGGQGAPLVPYADFLLYRSQTKTVALQNIGGIGNISILPKGCNDISQISAFDTGPGNMLIDSLVSRFTNGKCQYDDNGKLAAKGDLSTDLLDWLMTDSYLKVVPPKSTGREYYGNSFIDNIIEKASALSLSQNDILATVTYYTAKTISYSIDHYSDHKPDMLIVGGGGSHNETLLADLKKELPYCKILTNESVGYDSDAKEALAFAILANETIHLKQGNVPSATGANRPLILGKISF